MPSAKVEPSSLSALEASLVTGSQGLLRVSSPFKTVSEGAQANPSTSVAAKIAMSPQVGSPGVQVVSNFTGIANTGAYPPDVQVGVGPSEVIEAVNLQLTIYSKLGSLLTSYSLHYFFSDPNFISDPRVLFDAPSGRWFISILSVTGSTVRVAVSTDSNLSDGWYVYSFPAYNNYCPDQPIIGISSDKLAISANDFTHLCSANNYFGAQYWIANKTELLDHLSTDYVTYGPDIAVFSVHPVQSLSATNTQYLIGTYQLQNTTLQLTSVTGVPPAAVSTTRTNLTVAYLSPPPNATQPGTTAPVNTDDDRIQDAALLNGVIWLTLNDACTPTGDTQARSCIRLVQINTTSVTVTQDFDYGTAGQYYFYPALRMDNRSDLALIYGYSSSTEYPGLAVTGQAKGDPPSTLKASVRLIQGTATETTGRYGDYFGAAVDPSNASYVWAAGEFEVFAGWATRVTKMRLLEQYFLRTEANPANSGILAPTSAWLNAGSAVELSASAKKGWQFHGWRGMGAGSYTGPLSNTSLLLQGAVNETADFYPGLTIASSPGGSVTYSYNSFSGSIPAGGNQTIFLPPGTTLTLTALSSPQDRFAAWTGTVNSTSSSLQITLNTPEVLSAHFLKSAVSLPPIGPLFLAILVAFSVHYGRRHRRRALAQRI